VKKLFIQSHLQAKFLEQGYLLVDLPKGDIPGQLEHVFQQNCAAQMADSSFFYYSLMNEPGFNRLLQEELGKIIQPVYDAFFNDYEAFSESFLVKRAGDYNELLLHQDWSYVDERDSFSVTVWIPLEDVSVENGGFFLIPGSHLFFENYRSCSLPTARMKALPELKDYILPLNLKAGQALFFHPAVFHGSFPNATKRHRRVAASIVKPKASPFCYFHEEASSVQRYHLDIAAFLDELPTLSNGKAPLSYLSRTALRYVHQIPALEQFSAYLSQPKAKHV
jgi:hypothetical protein